MSESDTGEDGQLLTSKQVADLFACSVRTIWRLVEVGQLPQPIRFNRKLVRWRRRDVLACLDNGTPSLRPGAGPN
jgi:predicted DNA-binding transcriptional regulator AlpA